MKPLQPRRGRLALYIILLAIALSAVIILRNNNQRERARAIEAHAPGGSGGDTLDVALVYGPASYYMYADTLGGYNFDLLRLLARSEKIPMKFWPVGGLKEGLRQLNAGKYDMLATLPVDADYKDKYLYSEPIYLDRQVLVQRKGKGGKLSASSALDLAGDTVHIEKDSPIAARLRNLSREIGDTIYIVEHADLSSELLTLKVQSGEMRYAVVNEQIARPIADKFPELDISSPISFTQFQAIVLAPGNQELLTKLNAWLKRLLPSPATATLRTRYHLD